MNVLFLVLLVCKSPGQVLIKLLFFNKNEKNFPYVCHMMTLEPQNTI